ncbi:MAG: PEGA domain-containing protein [Candidatus Gracilibacteria bacterium]|nr:PEGA domain-containing protein [Candidatus Peregrinibacteria bacterium]
MKKKLTFAVFRAVTVVIFIVVSVFSIFFAYGYRVDFSDWTITKTSIVDVVGPKMDALVSLDGVQHGEELPFQISNVLPGRHEVAVVKRGFHEWSRVVEVEEDVVSIVRDLLLVPTNPDLYTEEILSFEPEDLPVFGDGYVLVRRAPAEDLRLVDNELEVILIDGDGEISSEVMSFYEEEFEVLDSFSDDRLFLALANDSYALMSLRDRSFDLFSLPSSVENIQIDIDGRELYFLESGNLYGSKIEDLPTFLTPSFQADDFELLREGVTDYALSSHGTLFFLAGGKLYFKDSDEGKALLVDHKPGLIDHFTYYPDGSLDLMTVFESADATSGTLLSIADDGTIKVIGPDVVGEPFLNDDGDALFVNNEGKVSFYDPKLDVVKTARGFDGDFELLGWFDNFGHFLVRQNQQVIVTDVFHENEFVLIPDATNISHLFVKDKAIFWFAENEEKRQLMRLYWGEAFE